ncbi:ABC transporter permease [Pontibacterium sp.]|jgi:putative ABC transport system permease protein|uniref:ABC transporter permease n=1 Tax=Pontibacterium sp. TaxID=2036026 RepID=UPI00356AAC0A
MTASSLLKLAWQQTLAAGRLPIWRALLLALTVAIAIATLLAVLGDRLEQSLGRQTADLLGADMTLHSSRPIPTAIANNANTLGLETSQVAQFPTMIEAGENLLLISLRAINMPYPLRGNIVTQPEQAGIPEPGTLWAEPSVLERLNLEVGHQIELGYAQFTIAAKLISTPDRGNGFSNFSPQVMINQQDLDATGLLGPGSRVRYRQLFAGDPEALTKLENQLRPDLASGERLITLDSSNNINGGALNNASRYLRLGALLTLLISALTIALSLRRYTLNSRDRAAVLLSLGMSARQLQGLFLLQLLLAWLVCALAGTAVALGLEQVTLYLLDDLLPQPVPPAQPALYSLGALLGLVSLITLGLPPMVSMSQVSVMHLFRRSATPTTLGGRLLQLVAGLMLTGLLMLYLDDLKLTLILIASLLVTAWLLGKLGAWLLRISAFALAGKHTLVRLLRLRLQQQQRWHQMQIPVISLLLALMAISLWARSDLLDRWQSQLPDTTPNHFLINIQQHERDGVDQLLQSYDLQSQLYPMIRGRISGLNGEPIATAFTPEQRQHNALNRELNLTWGKQMPAHNRLLSGQWVSQSDGDEVQLSVEQEFANTLGLTLGDQLMFSIGSHTVEGTISSIRSVQWESFQPNFYVIFTPGALDNMPVSYITSFYASGEQRKVGNELLQQFPTITLIDIEQLLAQARSLIGKLSDTSGLVMLLTLLAGLVLVFTTLSQELDQRRYENALLHTLGATPQQCQQLDLLEFALLGLVCGGLAAALGEIALWFIHQRLVLIEPVLHPTNWLLLPLAATALFTLTGLLARRRVDERNSYQLLRRLG